ncbi:MAG: shikimate kinase [Roseburia sp.]|nr:shikimate kinase [Roseburia sp.]
MKNIFLIGFMGSGKSTIAKVLSEKLGVEQVEMDEMIVQEQGMPITEIFEKFGEEHFRDIETDLVRRLQEKDGVVVSCGGGAVLREANREMMKKSGAIVLLTAKPETILERVKHSTNRPILNGNMNVEYIAGLMEKRRACYEDAADFVIETDDKSREEICDEILTKLKE